MRARAFVQLNIARWKKFVQQTGLRVEESSGKTCGVPRIAFSPGALWPYGRE